MKILKSLCFFLALVVQGETSSEQLSTQDAVTVQDPFSVWAEGIASAFRESPRNFYKVRKSKIIEVLAETTEEDMKARCASEEISLVELYLCLFRKIKSDTKALAELEEEDALTSDENPADSVRNVKQNCWKR